MRASLLLLPIHLLALTTLAAQTPAPAPADGALLSRAAYRLPPFDGLARAQVRDLTRYSGPDEYQATRSDRSFVLEKVRYASDGLEVVAYFYAPAGGGLGGRPLVIYNRGSWVAGDLAPVYAPLFRRLARAGFAVLAPQYRGSDGGEGTDELGGADLADVLNLVPLAAALGGVDTSRLFMYGASRGGMMTLQAVREGMPLHAAATVGAFTDLEALAADERAAETARAVWPDYPTRRREIADRRSAVRWADRLATPLLILHGGDDAQVPASHSLRLAGLLQGLGRPYELHVIAGGSHTLGERSSMRDSLVIAWFQAHR